MQKYWSYNVGAFLFGLVLYVHFFQSYIHKASCQYVIESWYVIITSLRLIIEWQYI